MLGLWICAAVFGLNLLATALLFILRDRWREKET